MSDEELRDAAERCADGWGLARTQTAPMSVLRELVADAKAVGRAYLAEHHADDGEPAPVGGLVEVGLGLYVEVRVSGVGRTTLYLDHLGHLIPTLGNPTRGQRRRLLAALGVPAESRP